MQIYIQQMSMNQPPLHFKAVSDLVEIHGPVVRDTFKEGAVKKWVNDEQVRISRTRQVRNDHPKPGRGRFCLGSSLADADHEGGPDEFSWGECFLCRDADIS